MKLKRVNDSKKPTTEQMTRMAYNIRTLYDKYCHISADARCYYSSYDEKISYEIYINDITSKVFETWPKLMQYYRKLIKEGLNERKT